MQHLVYDIQGNQLNIGDTVAFSYATNKALVIGTVNKIGELIKRRGYRNQFIGTRIDIGHTSVWANSSEQVLLIKKSEETPIQDKYPIEDLVQMVELIVDTMPDALMQEILKRNQTPSHKKYLAVVNYDHEAHESKMFDTDDECKVWLFDKIKMGNSDKLYELVKQNLINGVIRDEDKIKMYDEFWNYARDWDLSPHILTWDVDTESYK